MVDTEQANLSKMIKAMELIEKIISGKPYERPLTAATPAELNDTVSGLVALLAAGLELFAANNGTTSLDELKNFRAIFEAAYKNGVDSI